MSNKKKKKKKEKKGEKALMERWKPVEAWSRAPNHLATPLPPKLTSLLTMNSTSQVQCLACSLLHPCTLPGR